MDDPQLTAFPFSAFNFSVEITFAGRPPACATLFSECDGLELNQEVKTIREGGNNGAQIRLAGATTYGTLTLKRGMTASYDLWEWFEQSIADPSLDANAAVVMLAGDRGEQTAFLLTGCRPLKLKAPALSAREGGVAIEELQVAYTMLRRERPQPDAPPEPNRA